MAAKIERKVPVRVGMVAANAALYVFTVWAVASWDAPAGDTYDALVAICGVIGAAILGDTYRPSGHHHKDKAPE